MACRTALSSRHRHRHRHTCRPHRVLGRVRKPWGLCGGGGVKPKRKGGSGREVERRRINHASGTHCLLMGRVSQWLLLLLLLLLPPLVL